MRAAPRHHLTALDTIGRRYPAFDAADFGQKRSSRLIEQAVAPVHEKPPIPLSLALGTYK